MATKIKGIYKGFKFISQIFVVKEREMEIGYPTDVKHVTHIGLDHPSSSAPSWMSEFKAPPEFTTALSNPRDSNPATFSPWTSQDLDQSTAYESLTNGFKDVPALEVPNVPKRPKRKKKTAIISASKSQSVRV